MSTRDAFQIDNEERVLHFARSITNLMRLRILVRLHADSPQSVEMLHKKDIGPRSNVRYHLDQMELMGVVEIAERARQTPGDDQGSRQFAVTEFGVTVLRVASLVSRQ